MTAGSPTGGRQYIHYNPDRTDYSVSTDELTRLESAGSNLWKDVCLVSGPLGLSCLINALAATKDPFKLTISLFLNYLFGVLGIILAVVFAVAWHKSHKTFSQLISDIKQKPKIQIDFPGTVDVGPMVGATIIREPAGSSESQGSSGLLAGE
jgi:hypothetical protein